MNKPFTVEIIKYFITQYDKEEISLSKFKEILNKIAIDWHEQQTRWIPVEERLPPLIEKYQSWHRSELCFCYNKKQDAYYMGYYHEGVYDGGEFKEWYDTDDFEMAGITHWRRIERPE